jgi:Phospholipase_D-nuclease N-terminal
MAAKKQKKQWSDLTDGQRAAIVVGGAVELVLTTLALVDLVRRPAAQVRGRKALWALGSVVQPVGPVAYLLLGRRHPH